MNHEVGEAEKDHEHRQEQPEEAPQGKRIRAMPHQ
jgi:hypothetical protein